MRRQPEEAFDSFFSLEGGRLVLYEFVQGEHVRAYYADRLALSYDSDSLEFFGLGEAEAIMRSAEERRKALRLREQARRAETVAVVMVARGHDLHELTLLLNNGSGYLKTFLSKAGLV